MFDNQSSAKNTEVKKLLSTEWKHLSQPHVMVVHTKYHRTRVQNVPQMDKVKEKLLNKLGYIPVFIFLQQFAKCGDSPGPYRNCDKALMLLYFMVQGLPFDGTGLPKSTLHRVYKFFFKEHYTENKKWAAYALKTWFSTPLLRVLTAQTENPTTKRRKGSCDNAWGWT